MKRKTMKECEHTQRIKVPELDKILGQTFPVLNDGFIRVVDYLGADESIVQAARVSYGKGTKTVTEDRGLIRYLMRKRHTTPFEMCEIKLHVRVPMDAWRQWIRHRTASVNEYSTRYSEAIDSRQITAPTKWRLQTQGNKQGSTGFLEDWPDRHDPDIAYDTETPGEFLTRQEEILHDTVNKVYKKRLDLGVAREQARKDLTLSTYTEAYWKIDLHNLFHLLSLRMDPHAQAEIRSYADIIGKEIVSRWVPLSWQAFLDYKLNSITLTALDIELIRMISIGEQHCACKKATQYGFIKYTNRKDGRAVLKSNREREEFEGKCRALEITPPWLENDFEDIQNNEK